MFWSRPKLISVINLNDQYIASLNEVKKALGGKSNNFYRKYHPKRIFVIDFDGDVMASQASGLAHEVTAILYNVRQGDEVLVRLTSPGGAAHAYGYAASQLERIKNANIPLTVAIDKVAASGGYMMACIADKIISAPYAIVGSIGVVAAFPNFNTILKNWGIDYKQYTAGKYKRTVSSMGPITQEAEEKFLEDLHEMHGLFKNHVSSHRPNLDIEKIATGEHWQGIIAMKHGLVDEIKTSDEYLVSQVNSAELLKVTYIGNQKSFTEKLGENFALALSEGFWKAAYHVFLNFFVQNKYHI